MKADEERVCGERGFHCSSAGLSDVEEMNDLPPAHPAKRRDHEVEQNTGNRVLQN